MKRAVESAEFPTWIGADGHVICKYTSPSPDQICIVEFRVEPKDAGYGTAALEELRPLYKVIVVDCGEGEGEGESVDWWLSRAELGLVDWIRGNEGIRLWPPP